jgi:hypothetical protein
MFMASAVYYLLLNTQNIYKALDSMSPGYFPKFFYSNLYLYPLTHPT